MSSSRSVMFGPTGAYRGWRFSLTRQEHGADILVQVETPRTALHGALNAAMVLRAGTAAHAAGQAGIDARMALEDSLTAILGDLPELACAYRATPIQQASCGLLSAAGAHARRVWASRYPEGVPAFEVVGAGHYDPGTGQLHGLFGGEQPTATAVLPYRNPYPHNENGTTDDFYGLRKGAIHMTTDYDVVTYERCEWCHLFVEPNDATGAGVASFVHLHRGDEADESIDANHEAQPSGEIATLSVWRKYGPPEMRDRFSAESA